MSTGGSPLTARIRVVATAGHVDHGKSTLLRALTGMEPDRWAEERERGLTIDLGFVWTTLPTDDAPVTVTFVDVPGHERFIANMLAGAGAVPIALFVVAADDGWSAQSQEHLDILDLLGVPAAVVAVTKVDLVDDDRVLEVAADVERRLHGTALVGAPIVPVDGLSRTGVDELAATLAQRLAATPPAPDRRRPRLWIDRAFTISGAGTVVTGTLTGGRLRVGQELVVLPGGDVVRVRGLQSMEEAVEVAVPGSRVAINLAGVDRDEVGRGHAVVGVEGAEARVARELWRATDRLDAWVRALPGHEVGAKGAWHLHTGSARTAVTLHPILHEPARPGRPTHVRIRLTDPLPLVAGDRFVLREAGRQATLGGGVVLDPDPIERPRGTDARLERGVDLDGIRDAGSPVLRLGALLIAAGGARPAQRARAAAGLHPDEPLGDALREVAGHLVTADALAVWRGAVERRARAHHEHDPSSPGADRDALASAATAAGCPPALAPGLVDALATQGHLRRAGSSYALPEHAPERDEARRRRQEALLRALAAAPFAPPALEDAARDAGLTHEELNELVQAGQVVRCGEVAFARPAVGLAVRRLAQLGGGRFTTAQAREALGTSRKYAIPLLEHLDTVGITEFDGQTRRLRAAPTG